MPLVRHLRRDIYDARRDVRPTILHLDVLPAAASKQELTIGWTRNEIGESSASLSACNAATFYRFLPQRNHIVDHSVARSENRQALGVSVGRLRERVHLIRNERF
jgi:hypothetical protein